MTRIIYLDTETTGLDPMKGDRITEIGCVEILESNNIAEYHQYINPERDIHPDAARITGLTNDFLMAYPKFSDIAPAFLNFIGDAQLVIHNAAFDMGFINAELVRSGLSPLDMSRIIDSLPLARKKFPGSPASLNALCKRFKISLADRDKHGALIDAKLLSLVYLRLIEKNEQGGLSFKTEKKGDKISVVSDSVKYLDIKNIRIDINEEEKQNHKAFIDSLGEKALWKKII